MKPGIKVSQNPIILFFGENLSEPYGEFPLV
jgi:hypothetical protein